jgi:hypothetical protein
MRHKTTHLKETAVHKSKRYILCSFMLGGSFLFPSISRGSLILGNDQLVINGSAIVGANFLNFQCNQAGDPLAGACSPKFGDFAVNASVGSFAQFNGSFGQIMSIDDVSAPLGTTFALPNFLLFDQAGNAATGNVSFTLTSIPLGMDPQSSTCSGISHCTPTNPALVTVSNPGGVSPFDLDATGNGTTASFNVDGFITDTNGDLAAFTGTFSTTFNGLTPSEVLATLGPGGTPSDTYAATFSLSAVPEPMTLSLVGVTLIGLGCWRRRKA